METRTEEWRAVAGYEGLYEVSNLGRVRSLDRVVIQPNPHNGKMQSVTRKGKILKQLKANSGYMFVTISSGNRQFKGHFVHRLVADAFIPNPQKLPHINHKDEDKTNNTAENLEWCDPMYNNNYGTHKKARKVVQMDMQSNIITEYPSTREAARVLGLNPHSIANVCRGLKKQTGGYRWKYKE